MEATLAQPNANKSESSDSQGIPLIATGSGLESESMVPVQVNQELDHSFADRKSQMNQFLCDYIDGNGAMHAIRDPARNVKLCILFELLIQDCRGVESIIRTHSPEGVVLKTMARMAAEDLGRVAVPIKEGRGLMPWEVEQLERAMSNIDIVARHYFSARGK